MHHAAFCDHVPILRLLYNKNNASIAEVAKDRFDFVKNSQKKWNNSIIYLYNSRKSTPLLLAATSGALDAVQCLVSLEAEIGHKDELGNTVIHLAASNLHTNIIEYFIRLNDSRVPTWTILVGK